MEREASISVVHDSGSGRPLLFVLEKGVRQGEKGVYQGLAEYLATELNRQTRSIIVESEAITSENFESLTEQLRTTLAELGIRQVQFVGLGAASALVQNLALQTAKLVRSMVIIDASMRPHPTAVERALDSLEQRLPFGLPLRLPSTGFNVRALAHRLRCPVLLVSTKKSSVFVRRELRELSYKAPNAWYMDISCVGDDLNELAGLISAFQVLPAKSPQKNLQIAS